MSQVGIPPLEKRLAGWLTCQRCDLYKTRRKVVLGRGQIPASYLFIGEAPGRSEDLRGEAFVGRAGKLLDSALADAARLARLTEPPSYYITNTVACIPTDEKGGAFRPPTNREILACAERVELTVRLVNPEQIILLGNVARDALSGRYPYALCLRHPAYLLRQGGTASGEYRTFVRELSDLFRAKPLPVLGPIDIFGDRIGLPPKSAPTEKRQPQRRAE